MINKFQKEIKISVINKTFFIKVGEQLSPEFHAFVDQPI